MLAAATPVRGAAPLASCVISPPDRLSEQAPTLSCGKRDAKVAACSSGLQPDGRRGAECAWRRTYAPVALGGEPSGRRRRHGRGPSDTRRRGTPITNRPSISLGASEGSRSRVAHGSMFLTADRGDPGCRKLRRRCGLTRTTPAGSQWGRAGRRNKEVKVSVTHSSLPSAANCRIGCGRSAESRPSSASPPAAGRPSRQALRLRRAACPP